MAVLWQLTFQGIDDEIEESGEKRRGSRELSASCGDKPAKNTSATAAIAGFRFKTSDSWFFVLINLTFCLSSTCSYYLLAYAPEQYLLVIVSLITVVPNREMLITRP